MTVIEIKQNISTATGCDCNDIKCKNCVHWGFNKGYVMNSMCESRCTRLKHKTWALQFCKCFKKM